MTPAQENHIALHRQLRDLYIADGRDDPVLADFLGGLLTASYWQALTAPDPRPSQGCDVPEIAHPLEPATEAGERS